MIDLRAEMTAAASRLKADDRAALIGLGVRPVELDRFRMCGIERISISNGLYAPSLDGDAAIISPVRVDSPASPESPQPQVFSHWGPIIDLVAWHPADPERWALRVGAAEWIGCIEPQSFDPDPVPVHRSVLDWLRAGCVGLVPLSVGPDELYLTLTRCHGGIIAADDDHARELRRALSRPWSHPTVRAANVAV